MWTYFRKFESFVIHQLIKAYRIILGRQREMQKASIHDIKVLHDSPYFIVVDKAPDVLINTVDKNVKVTVERQLELLYPDLVNPNLGFSFWFAHRLDYSTSGVLCIAKTRRACAILAKQFESRCTEKYYLALVRGHLSQDYIEVNEPIGDDSRGEYEGFRMATPSMPYCIHETCRSAKTALVLLETGLYDNYPASKILLRPVTGRRHQLRVHCHIIGHTIVGDFTYSNRRDVLPHRMYLHAYKLVAKNRTDPLNVTTDDPFSENLPENKYWIPYKRLKTIDEGLERLSGVKLS